ncbi:MAG: hypothetical protein WDZ80_00845 [Candidatus Paceibacterota bacterium]
MSKQNIITLLVAVLVIAGLIVFISYNQNDVNINNQEVDEEEVSQDQDENEENEFFEESEEESDTRSLPSAVFNTMGTIISVGSDFIMVNSDASHMEEGNEIEITVNIVDSTNILDAENNSISLSDLNEGDRVSIEGADNIKNITEFDGSNIKLAE